ncbi:hypothetical protein [Roseovarius ramblicola]|uniref:D-galactarate dehydratase n=1 Tax=Roseovarius ramblicola TaxID=2022336 RepID=A0ABV5I1V7_9RHOB
MSGFPRVVLVCLLTGGCALPGLFERSPAPPPDTSADAAAQPGTADATGAVDEAEAGPADPAPTLPATTIASLGDVARPGLWMRTPLVVSPVRGRVSDPASGASVAVDLIPLDAAPGAGSRMSLDAYRALDLPLTGLPELRVDAAD